MLDSALPGSSGRRLARADGLGLEIGNGLTQAHEHGMTDERVTNVQLGHVWQGRHQGRAADVPDLAGLTLRQSQTVTGMGAQAKAARKAQAFLDAREFALEASLISIPPGMSQGARMELHTRGPGLGRGFDLHRVGTDEQGNPAASGSQSRTRILNTVELTCHVQPTFRGDLLATLGYQADMLWAPCAR